MAKKKYKYYAWFSPNGSGVFTSWEECKAACFGKPNERHKGFDSYEDAWNFAYPNTPMPVNHNEKEDKIANTSEHFTLSSEAEGHATPLNNGAFESDEVPLICADDEVSDEVNAFCDKYGFSYLSDQQKRAVQSINGKTLLFAVPGSGKTTVIIARTGFMIYSRNIPPSEIMSLTFTKAAANEMNNRFREHFRTEVAPYFRTIHSLCYSIILPRLKKEGFNYPPLIGIDNDIVEEESNQIQSQAAVFRTLFKELKCPVSDFETAMEAAQCVITGIKNSDLADTCPSHYEGKTIKLEGKEVLVSSLFNTYQKILRNNHCMDFDDLLIYAFNGLKKHPAVLDSLRNRYKYWNVDEAQDNSRLQFMLLDLICGENGNLFMVGDDDQSIYCFRGANPKLLRAFGHRPDVKTLLMGHNYRSDRNIVNAAREFIENNKNRQNKEMLAFSENPGQIFIPRTLKTEAQQYSYIIDAAKEANANGDTIAVLYRRNISCLPLIAYLHKNGISYESNKGLDELLRSKHIRNLWTIMAFVHDMSSMQAFNACKVQLGIHLRKDDLKDLKARHEKQPAESILNLLLQKYAEEKNEEKTENICKIISYLDEISRLSPAKAASKILQENMMGIDNVGDRLRVYSFLSVCDLYASISEFVCDMNRIIAQERKIYDTEDPTDFENSLSVVKTEERPRMTLSSMHSSKGREFDRVIIIDTLDEIMPGREVDDALFYDPEEELRLFYVAVTRAAHRLDLITVDKYHGNSERISRFIRLFAFISEQIGDGIDILNTPKISAIKSGIHLIEPAKYYAVKNGRTTGVFSSWAECRKQVDGYSCAEYKAFPTLEEAEKYLETDAGLKAPSVNLSFLDGFIVTSEGVLFHYPIDLPDTVNHAIYQRFGVASLSQIRPSCLDKLRRDSHYIFTSSGATDYSDRADAYLLAYTPVNFYKIWKPLIQLAQSQKLPRKCSVLELGAGPGTSTLGLMNFYLHLAKSNLSSSFELRITAVEREPAFQSIFKDLTTTLIDCCPENLKVEIEFVLADALADHSIYREKFSMIVESNMLNASEDSSEQAMDAFIGVVEKALDSTGFVITIEPGTNEDMSFLSRLAENVKNRGIAKTIEEPALFASDVSGISLYRETVAVGMRKVMKPAHWFSYMILGKEEFCP